MKERSLKELNKEVRINSSDLDSLYTRIERLEKMLHELAEQTDTYLPSFASKVWKK
jgi:prefoldin subunit 5